MSQDMTLVTRTYDRNQEVIRTEQSLLVGMAKSATTLVHDVTDDTWHLHRRGIGRGERVVGLANQLYIAGRLRETGRSYDHPGSQATVVEVHYKLVW